MTNKRAFIFPGQGSQSEGMLASLANQSAVTDTFAEASEVLGYDLWHLVQNDANGNLNQTHITQPAILTASVALWRLWQKNNTTMPDFMAGHSLGEYSALVCSQALSFSDAVALVEQRGLFMQAAVPEGEGAMAAIIGLPDTQIESICAQTSDAGVVAAVNYNAPGQVVIAGERHAVTQAIELCKQAGAKRALPLPVSVPSHCALMLPAANQLEQQLVKVDITMPVIPVIHNVNAKQASSPETLRQNLVNQLYQPVLWTQCIQTMAAQGVTYMLECGPGKVLTGLNKRIDKSLESSHINDLEDYV